MVGLAVVSRDDLILEEVVRVDRLHGGFRDLEHDAPVETLVEASALRNGTIGKLHGGELLGSIGLVVGE